MDVVVDPEVLDSLQEAAHPLYILSGNVEKATAGRPSYFLLPNTIDAPPAVAQRLGHSTVVWRMPENITSQSGTGWIQGKFTNATFCIVFLVMLLRY